MDNNNDQRAKVLPAFSARYLTPKESPEEVMRRINPGVQDVFMEKISRGYDEREMGKFFLPFKNWETAREFLSLVQAGMPQKGVIAFDYDKVKQLRSLDVRFIDAEYKKMHDQNILVTPFTLATAVTECSVLACEGVKDQNLILKAHGGVTFELPLIQEQAWYDKGVAILKDVGKYERKKIYHFYPYDERVKMITMAFSARYECYPDGSLIAFRARPGVTPPLHIDDLWDGIGQMMGALIGDCFQLLQNRSVDSINENNQLALLYSVISKHKILDTLASRNVQSYVDFCAAYEWFQTNKPHVVVGIDPALSKDKIAQYYHNGMDPSFADVKLFLNKIREWRKLIKTLDDLTHDLCMEYHIQHIPQNKWGPVHRVAVLGYMDQLIRGSPERKSAVPVASVSIIGSGSDYVARSLEAHPTALLGRDGKQPTKDIYSPATVTVTGDIRFHTQKSDLMDFKKIFASDGGANVVLLTDYAGLVAESDENITALGQFMTYVPPTFKGIAAFAVNLSDVTKLFGVISAARSKGFGIHIFRHPRRHNDHFFFIISSIATIEPPLTDAALLDFHFGLCNEIEQNNKLRDIAMWTGFEPARLREPEKQLLVAFGCAMKVKDAFKSTGKKGQFDKKGGDYLLNIQGAVSARMEGPLVETARNVAQHIAENPVIVVPPRTRTRSMSGGEGNPKKPRGDGKDTGESKDEDFP